MTSSFYILSKSFLIKRLHSKQKIIRLTVNHKVTRWGDENFPTCPLSGRLHIYNIYMYMRWNVLIVFLYTVGNTVFVWLCFIDLLNETIQRCPVSHVLWIYINIVILNLKIVSFSMYACFIAAISYCSIKCKVGWYFEEVHVWPKIELRLSFMFKLCRSCFRSNNLRKWCQNKTNRHLWRA